MGKRSVYDNNAMENLKTMLTSWTWNIFTWISSKRWFRNGIRSLRRQNDESADVIRVIWRI